MVLANGGQMSRCPNCGSTLEPQKLGIGVLYRCNVCDGAAVGINALKNRNSLKSFVDSIWRKSKENPILGQKACPFCGQLMIRVSEKIDESPLELDICGKCMMVWFDKGEQEMIPRIDPEKGLHYRKTSDLSPEAAEALAVFESKERRRQRKEIDLDNTPPETFFKKMLTILGFPTTSDNSGYKNLPIVLSGVIAVIIAVYISDLLNGHIIIKNWSFVPRTWYDHYGFNSLSSFFLHADFWHILFNLYFFLLFGRKVERDLGKLRFAGLLFVSHLFGIFIYTVLKINSGIPIVGASAGISGVMAYYALRYPKDKIHLFFWIYFHWYWLRFSIRIFFIIYVAFQILGAVTEFAGRTAVSYIAHLGGIFGGIVFALWVRESRKENAKAR